MPTLENNQLTKCSNWEVLERLLRERYKLLLRDVGTILFVTENSKLDIGKNFIFSDCGGSHCFGKIWDDIHIGKRKHPDHITASWKGDFDQLLQMFS